MYSGLENGRVLFVDKVAVMPSHYNVFLLLCAGQPAKVSIKYTGPVWTNKMPVIFLSNDQDILPMSEERWQRRIVQIEVKELEGVNLKKRFKKPIHPLGWLRLFDEHLDYSKLSEHVSDDDDSME